MTSSESRPSSRTAVVTGGSRGLGYSIAAMLIADGVNVVLTGRDEDALCSAVERLGQQARGVRGSVIDPGHAQRTIALAMETFGSVDILVNNAAAVPPLSPLMQVEARHFERVLSVNAHGALLFTQAAWSASMERRGGSILNIASVGGLRPIRNAGAYGVSKAALLFLTKQLAVELAPGVRVNALAPGPFNSGVNAQDELDGDVPTETGGLGRLGKLADMVAAARYLLSGDSGWVTGETITVDGGTSLEQRVPNDGC